ncbi:MAG: acyl-CoA thioesterase [Vampirovibrio sp.]|nr:acyl-CoA thioesterase [Vampirovibrio sp.]
MSSNTSLETDETKAVEYIFEVPVHIFDTDCYGVMWHGAYTKWLEMGRVDLLKSVGISLPKPEQADGYVCPVVDQHFTFKHPARMNDVLILTSRMTQEGRRLVFQQTFTQKDSGKTVMIGTTKCVLVDQKWKPLRQLPEEIQRLFN